VSTPLPRRFALVRPATDDGRSAIGVVAFGVAFSDGHIVLRWNGAHPATSNWESLADMLAVHSRDESTTIQWIDAPATEPEDWQPHTGRGRRARRHAMIEPPAPVAAAEVPESAANGFSRPLDSVDAPADEPDLPPAARPPGRHRRVSQVEQPV
jgi:hypothetical protein